MPVDRPPPALIRPWVTRLELHCDLCPLVCCRVERRAGCEASVPCEPACAPVGEKWIVGVTWHRLREHRDRHPDLPALLLPATFHRLPSPPTPANRPPP